MAQTPLHGSSGCRGTDADPVDRILAFLAQFVSLDEAERQLIRKITRIENYPQGTIRR